MTNQSIKITVVDNDKLVVLIGAVGMRVDLVGRTVSGPTRVRDANVNLVNSIEIQLGLHCFKGKVKQ